VPSPPQPLPRYVVVETADGVRDYDSDEPAYWVAQLVRPQHPMGPWADHHRLLHREPISWESAMSAINDLNRGGTGRGPGKIPEDA
jgi:hypothetical protein